MKNYFLAFALAVLVVLTGFSVKQSMARVGGASTSSAATGIGGSPMPVPPDAAIGGSPMPVPPDAAIGGSPMPVPPDAAIKISR